MLAVKITIANDLKTNQTTKIANMHNVQIDYCFFKNLQNTQHITSINNQG